MPSIQATHTDLYRSGAAYKTGYRCSEGEEGQGRVRARWTADRSVLLIVVAFQATVTLAQWRRR
ncbi:hypothetical protein IG631_10774 [Alternaria alternata]|nr:hypothetical protein IG631_10774 [Alternaria alternata]